MKVSIMVLFPGPAGATHGMPALSDLRIIFLPVSQNETWTNLFIDRNTWGSSGTSQG
jgi:hypothetical protein